LSDTGILSSGSASTGATKRRFAGHDAHFALQIGGCRSRSGPNVEEHFDFRPGSREATIEKREPPRIRLNFIRVLASAAEVEDDVTMLSAESPTNSLSSLHAVLRKCGLGDLPNKPAIKAERRRDGLWGDLEMERVGAEGAIDAEGGAARASSSHTTRAESMRAAAAV